ncbi:MAG: thiosulfate oxidation carrier complex protein SoxZ [Betaproteobacteria bacterium]|nr:thiosulfate oxidation carrier complex protein SoxZ [Betaproteobacteria bacterium]
MGEPMRIRASMVGERVEVKVVMAHAMETGLRKGSSGAAIPAHFIQTVTVEHNGNTVLSAQWGPSISRNPFLHFRFRGGIPGEKVTVTWIDNRGDRRTDQATIAGP